MKLLIRIIIVALPFITALIIHQIITSNEPQGQDKAYIEAYLKDHGEF